MLPPLQYLIDALFPPQCIPCGKKLASANTRSDTGGFLSVCEACFDAIPIRTGFVCSQCGARQPTLVNECHKGTPIIAAATEYSNYETQALIHALKYEHIRIASAPLAKLIVRHISTHKDIAERGPFLLIPIPLHKKKESKRGYNQSELLARELTNLLPQTFSLRSDSLIRIKNIPSQTTRKTHSERADNVEGSFLAAKPEALAGKIIFVIDDVSTSGATIREAARVLKRAGARNVLGLVVAKA